MFPMYSLSKFCGESNPVWPRGRYPLSYGESHTLISKRCSNWTWILHIVAVTPNR